ncbi:cob(I)yrinic acid a c-diamide adenosyltransferase [filamentous cyanobacterium CCP5]|nr:cob(I)yrinic acid a c-diamide adenosyltransferase [filamentous cyanobacterium CCP5]
MVSQLKVDATAPIERSSLIRHPLMQTIEGTIQVFTSPHRNFFANVMVQALRVAELGKNVLIVQFLKGGIGQGPNHPMQLGQNLDWIRADMEGCVHNAAVPPSAQEAIADLWRYTQTVIAQGRYTLVVLDELSLAMRYGLLSEVEVMALLQQRPPQVDLTLTGPDMPKAILDMADQVTEFRRNYLI